MAGSIKQQILQAEKQLRTENWQQANTLFRAVLRKRPDNLRALTGAAEAAFRLGAIHQSEQLLTNAARLRPNDAGVLVGRGRLHAHRKQYQKALQLFQAALKQNPKYTPAMLEAALVFTAVFQPQQAVPLLRRALSIDPNNMPMQLMLGNACQQMGWWKEAVSAYETARSHGYVNDRLLANLATTYRAVGQFENAESTFLEALKLRPDFTEAKAGLAELYETTGRTDKAQQLIDESVRSNKNHTAPFFNVVARIAKKSGRPAPAITFLQNALNEPGIIREHRAQLLFQLGALLEQNQQYDEAFIAYQNANELFPKTFDPAGYSQFIDNLIATYNQTKITAYPKSTNQSTLPVFIVGMPRSGTSLVEQIIAAHPNACAAGELTTLSNLITTLPKLLNTPQPYPRCMDSLTTESLDTIAAQYLNLLNEKIGDDKKNHPITRITDKMPHNFTHLGFISLLFPNAKIIHCTRNPVDNCFSCYATSLSATHAYSNNLENLAVAYRAYRKLMEHFLTILNPENICEISYEQLVADPEPITKSLIAFLDLPWDDSCLRFHENKRIILTASQDQANQPVYTSSVNRAEHFREHLGVLYEKLSSCE